MSLLIRQPRPFLFLLLVLVALASVFGRPDIPIDETRYVSVAWEMWNGGTWLDFLVPHKNGEVYHHKPPLLFWLINLGWWVAGLNDWWPRLISALFALGCLPVAASIATRLWRHAGAVGERTSWLLTGSTFWLFFATSVVFDVMLTFFVLLALWAALRAITGERRGTWGVFGLAIGLGILSKGPVVFLHVLPVLLLAPWWAPRRVHGWYRQLGWGVLIGAAIALAWAIPAALVGGEEFRNAIFWGQTAGRVTGSLAHRQPFWFYLAALPVVIFPWIFWGGAWRALFAAFRERGDYVHGVRFCLAWLLPAFIVFSLAGGKQVHYILPLLPALTMLMALGRREGAVSGRLAALPLALVLVTMGVLFLLPGLWIDKAPWLAIYTGTDWQIGGGLLVGLAVLTLLFVHGEAAAARLAMISGGVVMIVLLCLLRPLSPVFDTTPFGQRLKQLEQQGVPVANAAGYADQFHYYGRLTRPLVEITRGEIGTWLTANPQGRVAVYLKRAEEASAVGAEFWQPYLEGAVVLVDARSVARLPASATQ